MHQTAFCSPHLKCKFMGIVLLLWFAKVLLLMLQCNCILNCVDEMQLGVWLIAGYFFPNTCSIILTPRDQSIVYKPTRHQMATGTTPFKATNGRWVSNINE